MRILQDAIESALQGLPEHALAVLIENKLAAQGAKLSARQRELLTKQIKQGGKDSFRLNWWKVWDRRHFKIELTGQDGEHIEQRITELITNDLPILIQAATDKAAGDILAVLKRRWRAESRMQRRELAGFRKRLYDRWRMPLEGLRMLVTMSRELGDSINKEIHHSAEASSRRNLIDVLIRLHARACQIAEEIVCLLENGFADGAMARWRTLHEVAVVALFVAEHGEDLAERYVLYQAVESKRAADNYRQCQPRLGYEPLEQTEIDDVQSFYDSVIARFGPDFAKGDYGWAGHHLRLAKPNFRDIEQAVGIDHLRAHYRMASYNVHPNPKGVFFKLGILAEAQVFLAGPSNAGLADPGHGTALSLAQVSGTLTTLQLSIDNNVALQMIAQLVTEIGAAFLEAHERLAEDDASYQAAEDDEGFNSD